MWSFSHKNYFHVILNNCMFLVHFQNNKQYIFDTFRFVRTFAI